MKQVFKFKLEDGTVITGANPVEALMQVKASTTGKTFDEKFKKEKQEKEVAQALAELEKLYDGYIELEKKIKSGAKVEKTPEVVVEVPEEKAIEPEETDQNEEEQNKEVPVATAPVKLFGVKEEIATTEPEIESEEELLNKNEVVRIVQFQIRNPREVSTVDMENLLAKYPGLVEKIKDIERRRVKSLEQEKENYDNDVFNNRELAKDELIQQKDGTYITKSEEIKALYEKNKALINLRADEEIAEAKK